MPSSPLSSAKHRLAVILLPILVMGCTPEEQSASVQARQTPWVRTMPAELAANPRLILSGSIQAEHESPVSFQIGGLIQQKAVQAGDVVSKGQLLYAIDPRDLEQSLRAAQAEVTAAESSLDSARDDLQRQTRLHDARFISAQALDRAQLLVDEASSRLDAARSRASQAQHAIGYGVLRAAEDGIITETFVEVGQVVSAGQPVAQFALKGPLEIEVFLPQGIDAPPRGEVILDGERWPARRREVSASTDTASRTVRARYQLTGPAPRVPLGAIAQLDIASSDRPGNLLQVPIGAIDERGQGARVWIIKEQQATPVDVTVVQLGTEVAQISADLPAGTPVIAVGTHLLTPGLSVREISR